jgi:GNAT superfamily N-acetyltransferase
MIPRPLRPDDSLTAFDSGEPTLDKWLIERARSNEVSGASRTYVLAAGNRVAGYYCLAAGSVIRAETPAAPRRNMPEPIPAIVLGRLAIDRRHQGQGLGTGLLKDAVRRTLVAAEVAGIRAIMVHALHERAARFYERHGFVRSPMNPLVLFPPIASARAAVARPT